MYIWVGWVIHSINNCQINCRNKSGNLFYIIWMEAINKIKQKWKKWVPTNERNEFQQIKEMSSNKWKKWVPTNVFCYNWDNHYYLNSALLVK